MSAAGSYTAERFCAENVCIFVEKRSKMREKLFWNQCNNFLEILKSINYNI
jgi:hypothetical protein